MFTMNCKGRLVSLDKPVVMGILNITPDSFHLPSRTQTAGAVLEKAGRMIEDGVSIIDVGAQSTRPGSDWVEPGIEWDRLAEVLPLLTEKYPQTIFSIDTFHHTVAEKAVQAGASIVNDVSAGKLDPEMIPTVARLDTPFVCMHMKGTPQTMSTLAHYSHLMIEIIDYFIERIHTCRSAGIKDIILDPGFGFAKKGEQNFTLLHQLHQLHFLGYPILLGVSRKSMITKPLNITAAEALNGSTVLHAAGLLKGARILRVHDVKEAVEVVKLYEELSH